MFPQHNGKLGYQLASLAISHLAPLIMYFAIRSHVESDTQALALAWFIPVVWTACMAMRLPSSTCSWLAWAWWREVAPTTCWIWTW
jgi:hypothetical protein